MAAVPWLAAVALPVVGASLVGAGELLPFGILRSVLYGIIGALALPALLAGDPEEPGGPEASASAGLVLVTVVGLGEAFLRGAFWFQIIGPFLRTPVGLRGELIAQVSSSLYEPAAVWSWGTLGAAALFALIAAMPALLQDGRRAALNGAGLVWIAAAAAPMMAATVPDALWTAAASEVPVSGSPSVPGSPPTPDAPEPPAVDPLRKAPAP